MTLVSRRKQASGSLFTSCNIRLKYCYILLLALTFAVGLIQHKQYPFTVVTILYDKDDDEFRQTFTAPPIPFTANRKSIYVENRPPLIKAFRAKGFDVNIANQRYQKTVQFEDIHFLFLMTNRIPFTGK